MATGATFVLSGASFPNPVGHLTISDRVGMLSEHIFGGGDAGTLVNRANKSGPNMALVGSPVYSDSWAQVSSESGGYGFDTLKAPAGNLSIIMVIRAVSGSPVGVASPGLLGFTGSGGVVTAYNSQLGNSTSVADLPAMPTDQWRFYCGTFPKNGLAKAYTFTNAGVISSSTAEVANTSPRSTTTLKVGTVISGGGTGVGLIAYAAIYEKELTQPQVEAAYASLKKFLARRQVAI